MTTHTRYDSGLRFVTVCLAVAVALGTVGVVAATPPTPPHQVYGTVTDQNGDAVGSVSVQLVYDGTVVNETTTDADGYYEFKVPDPDDEASDERLSLVVAGADTGDEVTWTAAGTTEVEVTVETGDASTTTTKDDSDDSSNDDSDDSNADYSGGSNQNDQSGQSDDGSTAQTTAEESDDTSAGAVDDEQTATDTATVEPPETTVDVTTTDATSEARTTTDGGGGAIPGFGAGVALVALVATGLLAVRRTERSER